MPTLTLPSLQIELRPDRRRVYVALGGELDIASTPEVTAQLEALLADGWRDLVLDLRDVTFMDSTGVLLLVDATRRAAAEGWEFAVVCAPGAVERVLEMTGADELLARIPPVLAP